MSLESCHYLTFDDFLPEGAPTQVLKPDQLVETLKKEAIVEDTAKQ